MTKPDLFSFEVIQDKHRGKKNILFLQGPLGVFFEKFALMATAEGYVTHKICFNAGDRVYARGDYIDCFRLGLDDWGDYLSAYITTNEISVIILYGDSRPYHEIARQVAERHNVPVLCLEEGYFRPGYITAEWGGNNANSPLLSDKVSYPDHYDEALAPLIAGDTFWRRAWAALVYYHASIYLSRYFCAKNCVHHRPLHYSQLWSWMRAGLRRYSTRPGDNMVKKALARHKNEKAGRLFFCPLQVSVDAQIVHHSSFDSVGDFMRQLVKAFAQYRQDGDILLFKHHPMDLGFNHYGAHLKALGQEYSVSDHLLYCFNLDLFEILTQTDGCLTVNSTVGFEAIKRDIPTFTFGPSFYQTLTYQHSLEQFFAQPESATTDESLQEFTKIVLKKALVPGDFYDHFNVAIKHLLRVLL